MLSRVTPAAVRARTDQRGFTLVELLVVMVSGMVVASGLFTILEVTLRQTTRTLSRVDATQRARIALETIENEMHSACVEHQVVPIMEGSTSNSVSFWSQYGNAVEITPVKRTITFDPTAGTLAESTYPVSSDPAVGGSAPNWIASGTASNTRTLLTDVAQSGSTPVFRYTSLEPGAPSPLPTTPNGLSEPNSERTTEVQITLVVKPTSVSSQNSGLVPNTVTNSVSLRLTPTPNPGTVNQSFRPCE